MRLALLGGVREMKLQIAYVCMCVRSFFFFNGDRDTGPADCDGSLVIGNVTVPNGKATVFIFLFSSL